MRKSVGLLGGAALLLVSTSLHAQVVNGDFELPSDGASGTDTVATGWTLNPAVGDNYTNPGQRCQFATPTPSGGTWSFWIQTFVKSGSATQTVDTGTIVPGSTYTFQSQMAFEVPGYNNVTLANQASDPKSTNTGDLYSYLGITWLNHFNQPLGTLNADGVNTETAIPAGSVTSANHVYTPYQVTGVAPAGAYAAVLTIGWNNGGVDGNTGGQSAFATDAIFGTSVPEPASLSLIGIGGMALLARRRRSA
jgi:hypothetical protein